MINKRIINVLILICLLFLSLLLYLTYFVVAQSEKVAQNPYNQRQALYELDIQRGNIMDRNGVLLAETKDQKRVYPYGRMYSHVIGYNSQVYGKSLLEAKYNTELLGLDGVTQTFSLANEKIGYDLVLTIDHDLQKIASEGLGKRNGAVVAINPKNGEVLTMVSKPDFDPNPDVLAEKWTELTDNEQSPLLPRAVSGMYAPGSTFKMITAAAAIERGLQDSKFDDTGSIKIGSKEFENQGTKAYGLIDMYRGFEVSSNVVFCSLGEQLGTTALKDVAERFGFNKTFDFDVPYSKSVFPNSKNAPETAANLAIGQGELLATPLQMAMVTAAVANDGVMMKPELVKSIRNKNGFSVSTARPQVLYNCLSADVAFEVQKAMINTVKNGTASTLAISGVSVGGKTGTSENERTIKQADKEHTWIVAFAPAEDPQIAVVVMMEYSGGSGAGNCGPIARQIISKYLSK